jgi:hypothetical protein
MEKRNFIVNLLFGKMLNNLQQKKLERKTKNSLAQLSPFKLNQRLQGNFDSFHERLNNDSLIILIFGKRGSGKSALGFKILENIYAESKRRCYVLGVKSNYLPKWIESINSIEQSKKGSVILVDEGAVAFSSRDSMKFKNKELTKLLAVARHKDLSIIFITQNTGLIDKNVIKLSDTLFIKEGSLLQLEMERPEIKKFYEKSKKYFDKFKDKKKYCYALDSDFEGMIEYSLPSFWTESLSKNKTQ